MKKIILIASIVSIVFASCTTHQKRILIYSSGDIKLDESRKNISVSDGTTHQENEIDFTTSDPVILNAETPTGKFTLEVKDDGLYIANLKNDTVVGSIQHVGAERSSRISQEQAKAQLDSLQQLVVGQNVSAANKNFFIPPGKIAKINSGGSTKVFGPYTSVPSSFDAGSVSEVYKFYTNKEVREIIDKLSPMTIYKPGN